METRTTQYTVDQIKDLAERTRKWRGWDATAARTRRAPVPRDFLEVASQTMGGKDVVLDMGCGNGRIMAALAKGFMRGIGIDISKEKVDDARLSLPMKLRMRVHFTRGSSHAVPAPDKAFSVVLNREAPLFPEEVDRALLPGGLFVTQQVGKHDMRAIYRAFDEARGPITEPPEELSLPHTLDLLQSFGFRIIEQEKYDVPFVFSDAASLLYWLQRIPVPPDFDIEQDADTVLEILDRLGTPQGIVSNEHRELLIMQKPG